MIIYHHNDLDGRASAAIMLRWAREKGAIRSNVKLREVGYKDVIDVNEVTLLDRVAILDFSFKPEVMAEIQKRALDVIWCDHHVTAKDYGYTNVPGYRDFKEGGLSGCECTWKYCHNDIYIPRVFKLIGDYDAWRLQDPASKAFYEGMKMEDTCPSSSIWSLLYKPDLPNNLQINKIIENGVAAIKYRDSYCASMAGSYGYETIIDGHKAYALNIYRFGSGGFGERFNKYPLCIAYIHDGSRFTVSLYSETVDVSVIARHYGGGGHVGAAGFVCHELPFKNHDTGSDS